MRRKKLKLHGILAFMMLVIAISSVNSVFATGGVGDDVAALCAAEGNPLIVNTNDCFACHGDGSGGSGPGRTAASGSDSAIIAFFCPPVEPPPPPLQTCTDTDNDGFSVEGGDCGPLDPNDNNPDVYSGAPEICDDGVDNDGNGLVDTMDPSCQTAPECTDLDGDGYNTDGGQCGPVDCNDSDAAINPGAEESCSDGIDNNCNGFVDTADPNAVGCPVDCTDLDGDGFSIEGGMCGAVDCDDSNDALNPGASEICDDNIDNNCDATVDAADAACQAMDEDEHRKDRHDRDRDEHDDDDEDKDENRKDRHDRDEDEQDDDDEHEAEDDDDDEAEDRKDRRKKQRRNRRHHDD